MFHVWWDGTVRASFGTFDEADSYGKKLQRFVDYSGGGKVRIVKSTRPEHAPRQRPEPKPERRSRFSAIAEEMKDA